MAKKKVTLPMTVDSNGIMETKLTRSEAIELMLEEAREQTGNRVKAIEKELHDLQHLSPDELDDLHAVAKNAHMRIAWNGEEVNVSFDVKSSAFPKWIKERRARQKDLEEERNTLYTVQRSLEDKGKAKLAIMKQVLESNDEGRKFLAQVEQMSVALSAKLFEVAKQPPAPKMIEAKTTVTVKTTLEA